MRTRAGLVWVLLATGVALAGCGKGPQPVELKAYPLNGLEGVVTQTGIEVDKAVSSDGRGSLRIKATEPTVVHLFEAGDLDVENARLIYQAKVRTENVEGKAYLEMWCCFADKGDFFSRGLDTALSGTNDWTTLHTPFFLKKGQNPDNVRLNLVIEGAGTVWIDDVRLLKAPLE
ncbi:MAG TPA: hypothetical protein VFH53_03715 [Phycisphaerae bacterium]|nr:hypothetical protein [Phycisphaerae bacterium]